MVAWQRARIQIKPGRTNNVEAFKNMQKNSEALKNVNSHILIGGPPMEKKLLTIGISSAQHHQRSYLLNTLKSIFFASSQSEQKHIVVLVHLADPDPKWLNQVISNISVFFKPYIQTRQLAVINTPLQSYHPLKRHKKKSSGTLNYVAFHSIQNIGYAFLMNFATNYSDYFLMIEDDVKCAPGFITQIVTVLSAWEYKSYFTLEFSQLGFVGKLFRTIDLPRFVHFLLLFYQQMPSDHLYSHFLDLIQKSPIQFSPSLFQHMGNYSSFEGELKNFEGKDRKENGTGFPNNPDASLFTDLKVTNDSVLKNAYSLDENFFYTKEAKAGNHITVILDTPAKVIHVQVLTGSYLKGENWLKEGQVELGYDVTNRQYDCDDYVLLGFLVKGILNKQVLSEESGKKVKCVRLLVTATAPSVIIVRHINLWIK
ncbi:PREDICTED: alpha-1,3-mannosyl-glycoprotein 4-beta-N-acetylglucosaminyltransferase C-like [Elephantulus edwardii]|uniref:alpha-1,3-mannosyl-glycoprotein 4-beta-N-acetylglucosaminyltransferase C-like n=1 Tax=Elephantulus edwardii TaxID=28737 RepID=UPI0003F058FD|nr:PREDICTED: alpha-1,3-mannosyl-glycoprotein 4-beta-N-acetylglucosaminyltransferase C-like [Elephantulus edwardii]